jgi:hypothetical protein
MIDTYLAGWVLFAQGKNNWIPVIRDNKEIFESTLSRLLDAGDKRAPSRIVFYTVVQVGGFIPIATQLGQAAAGLLGASCPVHTDDKTGERSYFAGDLYFWWQAHSQHYEPFVLFEDWMTQDFARNVAIPMYSAACGREPS